MKNLKLLAWLTQLGLSVALPPAGFIFLGVWLRDYFDWGSWVIWVAIVLGLVSAVEGLRTSLKAMERSAGDQRKEQPPSFNDHD